MERPPNLHLAERQPGGMVRVMIDCPATGKPVFTGMNLSAKALEGLPVVGNILRRCPECGRRHTWTKEDAYLEED